MFITNEDLNNVLIFLKRTPLQGLKEAEVMVVAAQHIRQELADRNKPQVPVSEKIIEIPDDTDEVAVPGEE